MCVSLRRQYLISRRPRRRRRRRQKSKPISNTRSRSKVTVEQRTADATEDPNFVRTSLRTLVRESRTPPSRRPTEIELSPNALASHRSADAPLPVGEPLIFTRVSRVSRLFARFEPTRLLNRSGRVRSSARGVRAAGRRD
jgi:hypothetical protein